MPSFTLKAFVSDHSLLFHRVVAYQSRAHSHKRPALVATTFLNSRRGRLYENFGCNSNFENATSLKSQKLIPSKKNHFFPIAKISSHKYTKNRPSEN